MFCNSRRHEKGEKSKNFPKSLSGSSKGWLLTNGWKARSQTQQHSWQGRGLQRPGPTPQYLSKRNRRGPEVVARSYQESRSPDTLVVTRQVQGQVRKSVHKSRPGPAIARQGPGNTAG